MQLKPSQSALTFVEMLARLYLDKHTGPVLIHFAGGQPQAIEILAPSERIPLDTSSARK